MWSALIREQVVPVLTSDRGAMAEVAGEDALLIDPEDRAHMASGLLRMAADGELRRRLASAGTRRARRWSWEGTAESTTEAYRRLLGPNTC